MSLPVQFAPQALVQVQAAHAWWKKNRPRAPQLLRDELVDALRLLRASPGAGVPYQHRRRQDVRRLVLQRTHYALYYVVQPEGVTILAVWSTLRGRAPPLR